MRQLLIRPLAVHAALASALAPAVVAAAAPGRGSSEVHVIQKHRLPSVVTGDQDPARKYDEVTIEFRMPEPVAAIVLRLPERQQCEDEDRMHCTGYAFRRAGSGACFLQQAPAQPSRLPSSAATEAVDLVARGMVEHCAVDNERGNGKPEPKRSTADVFLNPAKGAERGWQFFSIAVSNPPVTPAGKDRDGHVANAFHVVFESSNGTILSSGSYAALEIREAWLCGYTDWVRTAPCSARCGGGVRYLVRRRLHAPPKDYDPALLFHCDEALFRTETCNDITCDVDCALGDWVRWADGPCTASCNGGWEVQRRRVISAPLGNGTPCPHWTSPERVRYESCNAEPCPPYCVAAGETTSSPCSDSCGGGVSTVIRPAARKEMRLSDSLEDPACASHGHQVCNDVACQPLHFSAGRPDHLPRAGEWFDLVATFVLKHLAGTLELAAPPGFDLARGPDPQQNSCRLIEHNMPRLAGCEVVRNGTDFNTARFTFWNPLEPRLPGKLGLQKYWARFWVRNPLDCRGEDAREAGTHGICVGRPGAREWTLVLRSHLPTQLHEAVTGGYEIFEAGKTFDAGDFTNIVVGGAGSANASGGGATGLVAFSVFGDGQLHRASQSGR